MKRFFFTLFLTTCMVLANAQTIIPIKKGSGAFSKSLEKITINKNGANRISPQKAASLDNTELWGYYLRDVDNLGAIGVQTPATYWAGYFVPGDGVLKDATINGVNLPIYSKTNMKDVSIWISEDLETNVVSQTVDTSTLNDLSYNVIALDEPFEIPENGIFIGVKFTISSIKYNSDMYPILIDGIPGNLNSCIMKFKSSTTEDDWYDYNSMFGSFAMQLFCSNITKTERYAYIKMTDNASSLAGGDVNLPVMIASEGSEGVKSIDYIVDINGDKQSRHLELSTPIEGGFGKTGVETIGFTAPLTLGVYTATINIDKVNGMPNSASSNSISVKGKTLSKIVTRKTVVEEFTGTGCGYCPRGWVGMEQLKEKKENFIGIAFHQYDTADPMFVKNYIHCSYLGITGAPGCSIDRVQTLDPYYGSSNSTPLGILDDFDYYNSVLPEVDINVSGVFNQDSTEVNINADIEYLTEGEGYSIVYVLTADGLSGTTATWRQSNYYYSTSPTGEEYLDQFCKNGKYGQSYVFLTFNDVMIGSSYDEDGNNLAADISEKANAGTKISASHKVAMPVKASLKNAINNDKVYAVAFVLTSDGNIANAAKAKVEGDNTNGIENAVSSVLDLKETARYNAAGQKISVPQKGLNIIKLSNGKTIKINVR